MNEQETTMISQSRDILFYMPRYRVVHRDSGEIWEVLADSSDDARRLIGWELGTCRVMLLTEPPFATIEAPKVAVQIRPPIPGTAYICRDCNVTLSRSENRLWWFCPSCELLFHSEEKRYYRENDL
jgi:hypothetical protein